jgi:multidrug efflux pump subunit AcrB
MIIAIGLLIDNAIVMTHEVRKQISRGHAHLQATHKAVQHLFAPLLASTLTTILGFMPIFLLPGNVGDFVGPIAISVVLALIGSFLISMTLIAALAGRFVRVDQNGQSSRSRWWRDGVNSQRLATRYHRGLLAAVQRPQLSVAVVVMLALTGFGLAATLGNQFFPSADRDQFEVEVRLPSGTSVQRSVEITGRIEQLLRENEGIVRIDWLAGGSFPSVYYNLVMDQDNDGAYVHAIVVGDSVALVNKLIPRLQTELDQRFPEAQILVSPFGQGPPYEAPVAFRVVGPNPDELRRYGEELRRIMHRQPTILHTRSTLTGGEPRLRFTANEEMASLAALTLTDIATQFQTNLEGHIGGSVLEDLEQLMVRIRYADSERSSLERMRTLNLVSADSAAQQSWIPAEAVGSFELRPELASITRRNGERVNKVLGYVTQGTLAIDVTRAILDDWHNSGIELAPGYRLEVAGDSEEQSRAVAQLATYVPVLAALMIATVVLSFRSAMLASIIATVAILSVGLGLLSLWASGYPLGFNPILGTAGLVGVAINGTIVVLAAIRANSHARAGDLQAIVAEVAGTTRHILSTTLTTIAGFTPLLLFTGGNFWPPLAVVIAGGVGLSALLSLLFTPAVYYWLHRPRAQTTTDQAAVTMSKFTRAEA